jgi:hypothetical protein
MSNLKVWGGEDLASDTKELVWTLKHRSWGKLADQVVQAVGLKSKPHFTRRPACSAPRVEPPAPQWASP